MCFAGGGGLCVSSISSIQEPRDRVTLRGLTGSCGESEATYSDESAFRFTTHLYAAYRFNPIREVSVGKHPPKRKKSRFLIFIGLMNLDLR